MEGTSDINSPMPGFFMPLDFSIASAVPVSPLSSASSTRAVDGEAQSSTMAAFDPYHIVELAQQWDQARENSERRSILWQVTIEILDAMRNFPVERRIKEIFGIWRRKLGNYESSFVPPHLSLQIRIELSS